MKPLPYRAGARLSDWYHGLRDGWTGIPDRDTAARYVTTPHREMLIRLAREVFEHERLRFERARGDAPERIAGTTARLDQLRAHQAETERHLAEVSRPLSAEEETWRRIGDLGQAEPVVIQRRRTEHRRRINAARLTLDSIIAAIGQAEADLARITETDRRERQAATTRVLRFHEYIHRRLDCYLRSLVRAHHDGAWAGTRLVVPPFLPGWITPPVKPPAERPPTPPAGESEPEEGDEPKPSRTITLRDPVTSFGAGSGKEPVDEVIDFPGTAPLHFTLTREGANRLRLRDFGHGHGPYRYGEPVKPALLAPGDHFDFADRRYYVCDGCTELEEVPLGPVNLIAADVDAKSRGPMTWFSRRPARVLLTGMTFVQRQGTVLAVLGPSGAGKTSLLKALIGDLPVERGSLFLEELDMRTRPAQISDRLGYVPQETALYPSLTVRQLLGYSFDLRNPGPAGRRDGAIEKACKRAQLQDEQLDQLVSTLSGGQKRRVSIAVALLNEPKLLILDEPTSGLDPGMDQGIMQQLHDYADTGKTVILTTHSTAHLGYTKSDILVVADHGQPVYFGRPSQMRRRLGVKSYADLMIKLTPPDKMTPDGEWADSWPKDRAGEYQQSGEAREARREASRAWEQARAASQGRAQARAGGQRFRRGSFRMFWRQLWALLRRQATLLLVRGRRNTPRLTAWPVMVALLPFIVASVAAWLAAQITPGTGLGAKPGTAGDTALSVLTTLAVLSGQALTYGDLVSDLPIIHREHLTGAILPVVMLSRWLVYAAVAVLQAAVMTGVFVWVRPGPAYANLLPPFAELFVDLAALTITAMSLGLLISALVSKLEQAIMLVTLTSITQIALNGVTAPLSGVLDAFARLLPDRWGLAAAASSVNLNKITVPPPKPADTLWQHTTAQWTIDLLALAVLVVVYILLATLALQRHLRPPAPRRRADPVSAERSWRAT